MATPAPQAQHPKPSRGSLRGTEAAGVLWRGGGGAPQRRLQGWLHVLSVHSGYSLLTPPWEGSPQPLASVDSRALAHPPAGFTF